VSFLPSVAMAPTFWRQTIPYALTAACSLGLLLWIVIRKWRPPRVLRRLMGESGAAEAVDMVLTFPWVLMLAFLFVQFAIAANASLIVHYAAYVAARAARVHSWERSPLYIQSLIELSNRENPGSVLNGPAGLSGLYELNDTACVAAADAARFALAAASPANTDFVYDAPGTTGCAGSNAYASLNDYSSGIQALVPEANPAGINNKLAYAFSPQNTIVALSPPDIGALFGAFSQVGANFRVDSLPMVANVSFRFVTSLPIPPGIMGSFIGPDGRRCWWMTAKVEVL
jgi:hypothetical protein